MAHEIIYYDNLHWVYLNTERFTAAALVKSIQITYPHERDAKGAHPGVAVLYDDVTGMDAKAFGEACKQATRTMRIRRRLNAAIAAGII